MRINIKPANRNDEIAQNVAVIASAPRGSVPLDRSLGIDAELLDAAGTRGRALLQAALIDALPEQEPRVDIKSVEFDGGADGNYGPSIAYEVKE